jgi:anti-sigma factor RsiW
VECTAARDLLLDHERGRLAPPAQADLETHLEGCPTCADEAAASLALSHALERRLPQHPAPIALKRKLAAQGPDASSVPRRGPWSLRHALIPGLAAALLVLGLVAAALVLRPTRGADALAQVTTEAVNDHLRVLERGRPLDVESGGIHQVRPWFAGKVDFAPVVPFAGDADFPLRGGTVERFLDRQAAVFVYARRLHTISLLVFRADGLAGLAGAPTAEAPEMRTVRGFHIALWRSGELGYALVSDADPVELRELASRFLQAK